MNKITESAIAEKFAIELLKSKAIYNVRSERS